MKSKIVIIILLISILIGMFYIYSNIKPPVDNDRLIIEKLDSLIYHKDSIKAVIDTNTVTIKTIQKTYEKNVETVINQSYAADIQFLKQYLSRYIIDSSGIKKIEFNSDSAQ